MSHDLRRRLAYFGPREKLYSGDNTEINGLPRNWRRVLGMSYPSPVVGPFGCVYADIEHAICGFRYLYTSNRPVYSQMFRAEVQKFSGSSMCRRWGSANGMSLLLTDPNDRVWILVRDRCMFDLVFQRISRDSVYREILSTLVDAQYMPVYHVRTANDMTYWGATMNRETVTNTLHDRSPQEDEETLYAEALKHNHRSPKEMLIGENRLGDIMVEALQAYRQVHTGLATTRVQGLIQDDLKTDLTPLGKHIISQAERELYEETVCDESEKPTKKPKTAKKTKPKVVDTKMEQSSSSSSTLEEEEEMVVVGKTKLSEMDDQLVTVTPEDEQFLLPVFNPIDEETANEILRIAGIVDSSDEETNTTKDFNPNEGQRLYSLF